MKSCANGILLNEKDSLELVRALDAAVEERVALIDSNLPPSGCPYSAEDKKNADEWGTDVKRWRTLRRELWRRIA